MHVPEEVKALAAQWLKAPYDEETQKEVQALLEGDPAALIDAFYTTVAFGTGGMRAVMGAGTNRLNKYTIRNATQGLANYILSQKVAHPKVFISYDSRINSRLFAEETARVLAGNGIEVFITKELRPTPFVSFGCRYHGCTAAVMITASHNPPEYNGYKVYWSDGAQVVPPHDKGIMAEVDKIKHPDQIKLVPFGHSLIHQEGKDDDEAYYAALMPLQNHPETNQKEGNTLKIIYSPLHGCGITTAPEGLKRWGFTNISHVEAQKVPDSTFPTAHSPNPEQEEALHLGIDQLVKEEGDLFIATDPDADRMGVVALHEGKPVILSGNQIASLCLHYLCTTKSLPKNSASLTTIVTTELFKSIAESFNVTHFEVLTGFKYIGEKIHEWEQSGAHAFLFGAEESLGFLYGTHSRDKDATIAACLVSEMALQLKKQGKTLVDQLNELYKTYGPFLEKQLSVPFGGGQKGMETMKKLMEALRQNPPKEISGDKVIEVEDYLTGKTKIPLPKSNVLVFRTEDQSKFIIRPSGTEPKIKIYGLARHSNVKRLDISLNFLKENHLKG
ncbi:phospho-sugar mutase [Candidatus Neptunochlamydia vexilliferae]|uniref:Phosphoglucomutase n=1 Tax=Candidatus Neptunichlamydia vexilliferae TaxID=1651774 RepID=A0ABS0B047_9BACT|nr:phospho-sugar mutase [Candidatus Neptunochlamydia vexilliferae]MBF5059762.1 Phosphoglucomutase [Candidatus Neptunochlamydia vexilliferae]